MLNFYGFIKVVICGKYKNLNKTIKIKVTCPVMQVIAYMFL